MSRTSPFLNRPVLDLPNRLHEEAVSSFDVVLKNLAGKFTATGVSRLVGTRVSLTASTPYVEAVQESYRRWLRSLNARIFVVSSQNSDEDGSTMFTANLLCTHTRTTSVRRGKRMVYAKSFSCPVGGSRP